MRATKMHVYSVNMGDEKYARVEFQKIAVLRNSAYRVLVTSGADVKLFPAAPITPSGEIAIQFVKKMITTSENAIEKGGK